MNKLRRIQGKALLCLIGVIILLVLAVMGVLRRITPQIEQHEPVVRQLTNVWIMEVTEAGLHIFDGAEQEYAWFDSKAPATDKSAREQVADVTLLDDKISVVHIKNQQKVSRKVLGIRAGQGIELEGLGYLPFDSKMKIYRLYDTLEVSKESDIRIGYSFSDYVIENGKICAVLLTRDEAMEYIRVQIKSSDYASSTHESVKLTSDTDFMVRYGIEGNMIEEIHEAFESVEITSNSSFFTGERVYIVPAALTGKVFLLSVNRNQGNPGYRGTVEIVKQEEQNSLYVVNEVLLEEYLYAVVPSEMPSSYPTEALKAQAICARTYAYGHMLLPSNTLVGAHVDDSAGYQVYNNIQEQDTTTAAVKATSGQLLYASGGLVETYYYSTSCGFGSDANVWKGRQTENPAYLQAKRIGTTEEDIYSGESMMQEDHFAEFIECSFEEDFEASIAWYRWTYAVDEVDCENMLSVLQKRYEANPKLVLTREKEGIYRSEPIENLGDISDIYIERRGSGGVADELLIETEKGIIKVISEHNIRYVLCDGITQVRRQDGSFVDMKSLLPSAFFTIKTVKKDGVVVGYNLTGGGFGHGVGMSQNAAKSMADVGYTGEEILHFFYQGTNIETRY